jgi:hypothetical protein
MRRSVAAISFVCTLVAILSAMGASAPEIGKDDPKVVVGTEKNTWTYDGQSSMKAKVGDPANRLQLKIKNGDVVHFKVEGTHEHGVIFENGKSQLKDGVFEVMKKSGELDLNDPTGSGELSLPDYYKRDDAKLTKERAEGPIITIKINKLEAGIDKGILFGCNPHSKLKKTNNDILMLGVIVLDEGR